MYLIMKQVPESVHKAAEELCVTKQHTDKPGGPQVLSGETKKESDESPKTESVYFQTCALKTGFNRFGAHSRSHTLCRKMDAYGH